jgi:hypothetical protein
MKWIGYAVLRMGPGSFVAVLVALTPFASWAQAIPRLVPPASVPVVSTSQILAIGTLTDKGTSSQLESLLPQEVRDTVRLYLAGKIAQWYFKPDDNGVVFVLNLTDAEDARSLLKTLPLGQAGLMEFQIIRLAPLSPLGVLIAERVK